MLYVGDGLKERLLSEVSSSGRVSRAAEERLRRVQLAQATWRAGGFDTRFGPHFLQAQLRGLARELRAADMQDCSDLLDALSETCTLAFGQEESEFVAHGAHVVLLDEVEVTRDLAALALESAGCVTVAVESLHECAEALQERTNSVLVVDPNHHGLSHVSHCNALRAMLRVTFLPVILFSDAPEQRLPLVSRAIGADGYLSKNQGVAQLTTQVDEVLSGIVW